MLLKRNPWEVKQQLGDLILYLIPTKRTVSKDKREREMRLALGHQ